MGTIKGRTEREARSHKEALALIASERAEREKKTAKLCELRLARGKEANAPKPAPKASAKAKPTIDMMKAAKQKMRSA